MFYSKGPLTNNEITRNQITKFQIYSISSKLNFLNTLSNRPYIEIPNIYTTRFSRLSL